MLKFKLLLALLSAPVGTQHAVYGPTDDGHYAVLGEGFIPTKDCTVTAKGMTAEISGDRRWITFKDSSGEEEGTCEVGGRPVVRPIRTVVHTQTISVR